MQRDRTVFLAIGGVLVNPDRGAVDHLDVAVISLCNGLKKPGPHALAPAVEAVHAGCVGP
jgi:hypothetical protein